MSADGDRVIVHTHGACKGNPGRGGWGVFLRFWGATEKELFGGEPNTTNNRMELTAAIRGAEAFSSVIAPGAHPHRLEVRAPGDDGVDPQLEEAVAGRAADKQPVKNEDLWLVARRARVPPPRGRVDWGQGPLGSPPENDRADALARKGMAPFLKRVARAPKSQ